MTGSEIILACLQVAKTILRMVERHQRGQITDAELREQWRVVRAQVLDADSLWQRTKEQREISKREEGK